MSAAIGLGIAFLLDIEDETALAEAACELASRTGCPRLHERLGDRVVRVEGASATWLPHEEAKAIIAAEPTIYHPLSYDDAFALLDGEIQLAVPEPKQGGKRLIELAGREIVCTSVADLARTIATTEKERAEEGIETTPSLIDAFTRAKRYLDVCAEQRLTFHVGWE